MVATNTLQLARLAENAAWMGCGFDRIVPTSEPLASQ